jgi:KWG repeat protein
MIIRNEEQEKPICLCNKKGLILLLVIILLIVFSSVIIKGNELRAKNLEWKWLIEPNFYKDIDYEGEGIFKAYRTDRNIDIIDSNNNKVYKYPLFDDICLDRKNIFIAIQNNKYFYVNIAGEKILDDVFDGLFKQCEDISAVCKGNLWGFIDKDFNKIIDYQFNKVHSFSGSYAAVMNKELKWGFIDKSGKLIIDFQYDEVKDFKNDLVAVRTGNKWSFIDKNGNIISKSYYDELGEFHEGFAKVKSQGKWGYIDTQGKEIINCIYDEAKDFSEGLAAIKVNNYFGDDNEAWAYIDTHGKEIIPFHQYSTIGGTSLVIGDFHDDKAFVTNDLISIIDKKGKYILLGGNTNFFISQPVYYKDYSAIIGYIYTDSSMKIKKYGLLNLNGKELLTPTFDYIREIKEKYMIVENLIEGDFRCGVVRLKK